MEHRIFEDRRDAGRALTAEIARRKLTAPVILGLPRGGVPVAFEIAAAIDAPLDVIVVRKLGAPFQPELALGAIASGGICVLNDNVLAQTHVEQSVLDNIVAREKQELERREALYRAARPYPELSGKDVVLVDDGMATGATMRAAAEAVRTRNPAQLLIAVPTASARASKLLEEIADDVICLQAPSSFFAVGNYYRNFGQTTDEEVRDLLQRSYGPNQA